MQIATALVWPAIALVFAGAFFYLWYADRSRPHLFGFGIGFFSLFLAMSVVFAFPAITTSPAVAALHALSCISVIAIVWGATSRLNQKTPLGAMCVVSVISCALLFFALSEGDQSVALLVQNGTSGLLFGIGAVSIWTARSTNILDRVLVWTISLLAGFSLIRPLIVLYLKIEIGDLAAGTIELSGINVVILTVLTAILGIALIAIAVQEAIEIRHGAARTDPISGFLDQRTFENASEAALATAHRLDMPVSLAVLELDWFARIIEKWGQDTSDMVVREISDLVRSWQRDSDIVGRIGEDKIGILLVGVSAQSAQKIIGMLREDVDRACNDRMSGLLKFTLTSSICEAVAGKGLMQLMRETLAPLAKAQRLGGSVRFVNGAEMQRSDLASRHDVNFVTHG